MPLFRVPIIWELGIVTNKNIILSEFIIISKNYNEMRRKVRERYIITDNDRLVVFKKVRARKLDILKYNINF